jgi:hypothetical protein
VLLEFLAPPILAAQLLEDLVHADLHRYLSLRPCPCCSPHHGSVRHLSRLRKAPFTAAISA